jgi:hypothetical protein
MRAQPKPFGRPPLRAAFFVAAFAALCGAQFRAGAAKAVITPVLSNGPVFLAGFGQNRTATGVHDDLYARCAALSAGRTLVLCGVDSIGLFLEDVQAIRRRVEAEAPGTSVVVAALHDHEAPDTMGLWGPAPGRSGLNEDYNRLVVDRVAQAAAEALRSMRPATLKAATVKTAELESFLDDDRPPRVHDSALIVLSLAAAGGRPVATVVNWANHPETLGSKNREITADYPGYLYRELERRAGGVAVFLNGAVGGMQSPLGARVADPATGQPVEEESFRKAEIIGTRVAALATDAAAKAPRTAADAVHYEERAIVVPVTNARFRAAAQAGVFRGRKPIDGGAIRTVAGVFRLSSRGRPVVEGAAAPGELYPELSVGGIERYPGADFPDAPAEPAIKQLMRAPHRMVIGLANDEIGYLIPKAEWDEQPPWLKNAPKRWYGEVNSVGPEAAPAVVGAIAGLLGRK